MPQGRASGSTLRAERKNANAKDPRRGALPADNEAARSRTSAENLARAPPAAKASAIERRQGFCSVKRLAGRKLGTPQEPCRPNRRGGPRRAIRGGTSRGPATCGQSPRPAPPKTICAPRKRPSTIADVPATRERSSRKLGSKALSGASPNGHRAARQRDAGLRPRGQDEAPREAQNILSAWQEGEQGICLASQEDRNKSRSETLKPSRRRIRRIRIDA